MENLPIAGIMLRVPYNGVEGVPVVWELDEKMNPLRRLKKEEFLIKTKSALKA